jgi:hypothetical protein
MFFLCSIILMDNSDSRIAPSPEAATDEPASPVDLGAGIPVGSSVPRARPPDDPGGDLHSGVLDCYVPVATDALGRKRRHDGFTPDRQCIFLDALARCGVAADACRATGISRDTAYNLRNGAQGRAFALGWSAAILISRGRLADELQSRALNGVVDKIYRNGELWGERHRHDNRLAMAVLTRLDRQAAGLGEGAVTARVIAQEWDQYLDIVREGGDGAGEFLAARASVARRDAEEATEPGDAVAASPVAEALQGSLETFERLFAYSMFGGGLDCEADIGDLEPAEMASWTERDWARAERGGLLDSIRPDEWPRAAREENLSEENGTSPICQDIGRPEAQASEDGKQSGWLRVPGLRRARQEYRRRTRGAAPGAPAVEQAGELDITGRKRSGGGAG